MTKKNKQTPGANAEESHSPEEEAVQTPEAEETPQAPEGEETEVAGEAPEETETEAAELSPEEKLADLNDKLLRALAESENIRRRAQRDKEDATKYAIANFARDMVPVADNMRRAMASVDADARRHDPALEQVMVGLEMTERDMLATFERFGIKTIGAMGQKFDHNFHEAMFEVDDPSKPHATVIQVVETGYVLNDRLLRPAKVGVSKGGQRDHQQDNGNAAKDGPEKAGAAEDGQTAYENKGEGPGHTLDEEL